MQPRITSDARNAKRFGCSLSSRPVIRGNVSTFNVSEEVEGSCSVYSIFYLTRSIFTGVEYIR